MAWCFHESEDVEEGFGSKALCKRCYDSVAPKDGTPNRKAIRANAKEAMTQQGERMRKYAQERAQSAAMVPVEVGKVVQVKVDPVDRGKLDHKSVPGVICERAQQLQNCVQGWCVEGLPNASKIPSRRDQKGKTLWPRNCVGESANKR
jgi:hypothetical protein